MYLKHFVFQIMNYNKSRYEIVKWMIQTDLQTFEKERNIEIIFTAVEIFDLFCLNRSKVMNIDVIEFLQKKDKRFTKTIAASCLILAAQYYDDHYEYVQQHNLIGYKNICFQIFEAIEFKIFPSKHLLNLYEFLQTTDFSSQKRINAFLAMIFSLMYFDTAAFDLMNIYKDGEFIQRYNDNRNFVKKYTSHIKKMLDYK